MITKCCSMCSETKPQHEFYSNSITGWSTMCQACRKQKAKETKKRADKRYQAEQARLSAIRERHAAEAMSKKIKMFEAEYKRFTLANRTQINQLYKKYHAHGPNTRMVNAMARRQAMQEKADAILQYQIEQIKKGLTPQSIYDLWSIENGDDTGKESQRPHQETA